MGWERERGGGFLGFKGKRKSQPKSQQKEKSFSLTKNGMERLTQSPQISWNQKLGNIKEVSSKTQSNPLKNPTNSIEAPELYPALLKRKQTPKEQIDVKTQIINGLTTKINYLTEEKNKLSGYNLLGKKRLSNEIKSLTKNQQEQLRVKNLLERMEQGGN